MSAPAIARLADLPFRARPPLELLALDDAGRAEVDRDYVGFGHCRIDELWLEAEGGRLERVADALVLALHSADDAPPRPGDIELEFVLDPARPDGSVAALLSSFLAARLPALRGDERAIVLALCNPHRAVLAAPPAAGATPVHYALGDVESWLAPGGRLILRADAWRAAGRG